MSSLGFFWPHISRLRGEEIGHPEMPMDMERKTKKAHKSLLPLAKGKGQPRETENVNF